MQKINPNLAPGGPFKQAHVSIGVTYLPLSISIAF